MSHFAMVTISRRIPATAALCAAGLLLPACTQIEKLDDDTGGATIPTEVQRAFNESCALGSCHDAASRQGGLDLSPAGAPSIIDGTSSTSDLPLVEIGNVQGSYLALKMLPNPPSGTMMPVGEPAGVDNQTNVAIILGWIAGATLPGGGEGATTDPTTAGSEDDSSSSGGAPVQECTVEAVTSSGTSPFDVGMDAGQIPPDVGAALESNCGCHESADVTSPFPYSGMVHFSSIAEIQADYMLGTLEPGYEIVLTRMENDSMPPAYFCMLEDGTTISDADRQLLIDWLMAGAPDAPTWMP